MNHGFQLFNHCTIGRSALAMSSPLIRDRSPPLRTKRGEDGQDFSVWSFGNVARKKPMVFLGSLPQAKPYNLVLLGTSASVCIAGRVPKGGRWDVAGLEPEDSPEVLGFWPLPDEPPEFPESPELP